MHTHTDTCPLCSFKCLYFCFSTSLCRLRYLLMAHLLGDPKRYHNLQKHISQKPFCQDLPLKTFNIARHKKTDNLRRLQGL
ncbi:hypothetical protein FKM82_003070 [Ascaphus truei]